MEDIEKASFIAYPKNISYSTIIDQMFDYNAEKRRIWIDGAKWEQKNLINKACEWLKANFNMPDDFELHFRKAMEESV